MRSLARYKQIPHIPDRPGGFVLTKLAQNVYHCLAKRNKVVELVKFLPYKGDIDARDIFGSTPLKLAVQSGYTEAVKVAQD